MNERPNDGLTSGDPLAPSSDPPRHESGLPAPEPPGQPAAAPWQASEGYTSPPPPGAGGYGAAPAVASSGRYELAGWWSRAGAQLIDGIIISIGALVVLAIFGAVFSVGFFGGEDTGVGAVIVGLILGAIAVSIVALFYAPFMMSRTDGKTLGRMAVGIRVMRADGGPMTFGFAMLREVAVKALLFGVLGSLTAGIANLIDYLWPLWDDENRALHDFVVNTRVVKD
jgi:uncharacterized RDD family membrane protein YckC